MVCARCRRSVLIIMRSLPRVFHLVLAASLASLAGCQSLQSSDNFLGFITPYRVDVVQGNVVTQEQVAAVKPGMSRAQIRDILGSPLLTDVFHQDRWDYVFTIHRQGAEPQRRTVTVRFDADAMTSIDTGGTLPAEREFVASIDTFKTRRDAPPLALTEAQIAALPIPAQPPAPVVAASAVAPTRTYPPLEPR
jgi:outer membrane protein assembly factor BamE